MAISSQEVRNLVNCYYCGLELGLEKPKRRLEQGEWHLLHPSCATKWDNEGKRL